MNYYAIFSPERNDHIILVMFQTLSQRNLFVEANRTLFDARSISIHQAKPLSEFKKTSIRSDLDIIRHHANETLSFNNPVDPSVLQTIGEDLRATANQIEKELGLC